MKAARKGSKAPKTRLQKGYSELSRVNQVDVPSTRLASNTEHRTRPLMAVNLIDAVLMTATNRAKALVSLGFSATS